MPAFRPGLVPDPEFIDLLIPDTEARRYNPATQQGSWSDLGARWPWSAMALHRAVGYLHGTNSHFRSANALTDFGIGVLAYDGAARDGMLVRWNDPTGAAHTVTYRDPFTGKQYTNAAVSANRAGHANGSVVAPWGDGKLFVDRFGINAVNRNVLSVEIMGGFGTPVSAKARGTLVYLMAWAADKYMHYLWDRGDTSFSPASFPLIPSQGNRSFYCWHQELSGATGCPGEIVMRETGGYIDSARELILMYGTQAGQPQPPEREYATPFPIERGSRILNDHVFLAPGGKNVQTPAAPRLWADAASIATGPVLPENFPIPQDKISHYVQGTDGDLWVVLTDISIDGLDLTGSRFPARALIAD